MQKLIKRRVEGIIPGTNDIFKWDSDLAGFGIRVKPSGVRSYLVQYRNEQGRSRRLTIGKHGVFTADQARKEAIQLLAAASRGDDPAVSRKTEKEALTIKELSERYLNEHIFFHNKKRILPAIGSLKAHSVTRQDISKLHSAMSKLSLLSKNELGRRGSNRDTFSGSIINHLNLNLISSNKA